jgi:concanavalin A-like lectin/glucanase superfamily protein
MAATYPGRLYTILIFSPSGTLQEIPQDVIQASFEDLTNGGSGQGTMTLPRRFIEEGIIGYGCRVQCYLYDSTDPWYDGYVLGFDPKQIENTEREQIDLQLEGWHTHLNDAIVTETLSPGVQPDGTNNGTMNADIYENHLLNTYLDPAVYSGSSVAVCPVPLDQLQFDGSGLGDCIDTVVAQVLDNTGNTYEWWVRGTYNGKAAVVIQKNQNPNIGGVTGKFRPSDPNSTPGFLYEFKDSTIYGYTIQNSARDLFNMIALYGGTDPFTQLLLYGAFQDSVSISLYGLRQKKLTNNTLVSQISLSNYAAAQLLVHGYPQPQGQFKKFLPTDRARAGQWFQIFERAGLPAPPASTPGYKALVLLSSPTAFYEVDEASGASMVDSSGGGHTGTYPGSGILYGRSGAIGVGTSVNLSGQHATWGVAPPVNGDFTVEGWFRFSGGASGQPVVDTAAFDFFRAATTGAGTADFTVKFTNTNFVIAFSDNSARLIQIQSQQAGIPAPSLQNPFTFLTWYHIAITYNNTSKQIFVYLNGAEVSQNTGTGSGVAGMAWNYDPAFGTGAGEPFSWGSNLATGNSPVCDIDELALYPTALSQATIVQHYVVGHAGPSSPYASDVLADNPLAYYRFDETTGAFAANSTPINVGATGQYLGGVAEGQQPAVGDGHAISLDGVQAYATIPIAQIPALDNQGSVLGVELWLKFPVVPAGVQYLVATNQHDINTGGWSVWLNAGKLTFSYTPYVAGVAQAQYTKASTTSTFAANTWYHIFVQFSLVTGNYHIDMYINGVLDTSAISLPGTYGKFPMPHDIFVGRNPAAANGWLGAYVDELALYDTITSPTRILHHYTTALAQPVPSVTTVPQTIIKQVRAIKVQLAVATGGNGDIVEQTVSTSAPLPYIDHAFYQVGLGASNNIATQMRGAA